MFDCINKLQISVSMCLLRKSSFNLTWLFYPCIGYPCPLDTVKILRWIEYRIYSNASSATKLIDWVSFHPCYQTSGCRQGWSPIIRSHMDCKPSAARSVSFVSAMTVRLKIKATCVYACVCVYSFKYIHTHTHICGLSTHRLIYIYIYIYICIWLFCKITFPGMPNSR